MEKRDLKTGMVVLDRDGNIFRVMRKTPYGDLLIGANSWNKLDAGYNKDLTHNEFKEFDIILVAIVRPYQLMDKYFKIDFEDAEIIYERR